MKTSALLFCSLLPLGAFLWSCGGDDDDDDVAAPSLKLSGTNAACGGNELPVPSKDALQSGKYVTGSLTVKGRDPHTQSGFMLPDTPIVIEAKENASADAGNVYFLSTRQAILNRQVDASAKTSVSQPLALNSGEAFDQFYCTQEGTVTLTAHTSYQAGGVGESENYESNKVKFECISESEYKERCGPQRTPAKQDAGVVVDGGEEIPEVNLAPWTISTVTATSANDLVIGTRGGTSGYPNSLTITFKVQDSVGPIEGVEVKFELPENSPPQLVLEPPTAVTNEDGYAQVILYAGGSPGIVSITATAVYEELEQTARSEAIVIRGGTPSMRSFGFACEDRIIPAFTSRSQDGRWHLVDREGTHCTVQLADRVQGRIDTNTQVFFLTEAGTMDETVPTDTDGRASSLMRIGTPVPVDIAPAGPSPKDGLVRVVAITRGEEDFIDVNGNKIYDEGIDEFIPGEHDLSDPYIDANDNGQYDCNANYCEEFRDANRAEGQEKKFSPPNGRWDADTEIWKSTLVLWVGDVRTEQMGRESSITYQCREGAGCSRSPINPDCPAGLALYTAKGGAFEVTAYFVDQNGNCPDGYHKGQVSISASGDYSIVGSSPNLVYSERPFDEDVFENVNFDIPCFMGSYENPQVAAVKWAVIDKGEEPVPDESGKTDSTTSEVEVSISYEDASGNQKTHIFQESICR